MPSDLGGSNSIENLWLLCIPCNLKKFNKHPVAWAKSLGLDPQALWPNLTFVREPEHNTLQVTADSVETN
jgi:hypothetical protein